MISTRVAGDVGQVAGAAEWLRGQLHAAAVTAGDEVVAARSRAAGEWEGLSGAAYARFAGTLVTAVDEHEQRIVSAAITLESYVAHLVQVRRAMSGYRTEARAGGLVVERQVIVGPGPALTVPGLPPDASPAEVAAHDQRMAAHDEALTRLALYERLADDVQREHDAHVQWIETNLVPAVAAAQDDGRMSDLAKFVEDNWSSFLATATVVGSSRGLAAVAAALTRQAQEFAAEVKALNRLRQGDKPGRSQLGHAPETRARVRAARSEAATRLKWLGWGRVGAKFFGPVGFALDGYLAYKQIQAGMSPGRVIVSTITGSLAAAAVVGATFTGTTAAAVLAAAVTAGLVAVGVSWAVGEVWDRLPPGFTNRIDDSLAGAWRSTAELHGQAWREVTGWF